MSPEMRSWAIAWAAWAAVALGSFLYLEVRALRTGGLTLSGLVWRLRESHSLVFALIGSLAVAVVTWLVWHFGIERDHGGELRRSWTDDGAIAAVALLLSLVFARRKR